MNHTERNTKITSPGAGFFATLGDLLSHRGSGALSLAPLRLRGRPALAVSLVLAGIVWGGSSSAAASQPHAFVSSFGSSGSAAGQFELTAESGLAVDQSTGDVYLGDTGNHRVDEFSASGAFIGAFGWGVADGAAEPQTCTATCQAGLPGPEPGQFERPTFIATDNTPGGGGDLYVADSGSQANERQTVALNAGGGSFTLSYTGLIHATTTEDSAVVTDVVGLLGREGDPVSGPGIPPGATMARRLSETSFELSAPATATAAHVVLGTTDTTASIPHNATAAELHAALYNLPTLEGGPFEIGSVCVSGAAGGPYTVEFCGNLLNTDVPQMTCDASGLTPAGATCTVETTVEGKDTARVQKFDPSGNLIAAWGGAPGPGEVDGTTCTSCDSNPHFEGLDGVGVKPEGALLVLNDDQLTEWAQFSGEFAATRGGGEGPIGIALDPAGRLYTGRFHLHILEVIQWSYFEGSYNEDFPLTESAPATGVAVDPSTEDVYVAQFNPNSNPPHSDVAAYLHEGGEPFEIFGGGEVKSTHEPEITEARGIAASGFSGSKSDVYVADPGAGRVEIFAPGGERDTLTVTRVGTGLGSVSSKPAGIACPFTCSSSFPHGEEVTLTATAPEHSSFVGWSGGGCSGTGPCQITLTAATSVTATFAYDKPVLTIGAASAITRHTATLNGEVNPEGDAFSCRFEYGATTAYGAEAPCLTQSGSGASPVSVSAELWDLAASTTYHYRLVSGNSGGAIYGPDQTFTTESESCATDAVLCLPPPLTCATDAALCPPPPSCATDAALCSPPPLKCRRGYVKKTVRGKPTCVKASPPPRKCRRGYVKKTVRGRPTCVKAKKPTARKKRG